MMDEQIWLKALFDEKFQSLYALALKLTRDREVSREIVSDAFRKVWERRKVLIRGGDRGGDRSRDQGGDRSGEDVGGYLYRCVRNTCIDHLRKKARSPIAAADLDGLTDLEALVDRQSISTEVAIALHATLGKLSRKQYEVIWKLFIEEKHKTVVAAEMKISVKTVEVHRDRGLKALKGALQKINLKNWRDL